MPKPGTRPVASAPAPSAPAPAAPASVAVAPAPPPAVALAPLVQAPPRPAPPPPTIPVLADAAGDATKILGGTRITFGAGKSDLNPTTEAAVRAIALLAKADPAMDVNVYAYAAGPPDDPSTPRRLSLSRALAARSVLISEGIASTRIYVRALGATPSDGPPDRVDVTQAGVGPAPAPPSAAPTPPATASR